jgi:cyclic-di-GMP-binding protein
MPSFDVVSKLERHEVENAIAQAQKEIGTRYDFRDTGTSIEDTKEGIVLRSDAEARLEAAYGVLQEKMVKRKVSLKSLDPQEIAPAGGKSFRQLIKLKEGVEMEKAKEIVKALKDSKMKVQGAIQGDLVRVSGKKKDDLQAAIAFLRGKDFGLPLQYVNFRE